MMENNLNKTGITCPVCGEKLDESAVFCPYCGGRLSGTAKAQPDAFKTPQDEPAEPDAAITPQDEPAEPDAAITSQDLGPDADSDRVIGPNPPGFRPSSGFGSCVMYFLGLILIGVAMFFIYASWKEHEAAKKPPRAVERFTRNLEKIVEREHEFDIDKEDSETEYLPASTMTVEAADEYAGVYSVECKGEFFEICFRPGDGVIYHTLVGVRPLFPNADASACTAALFYAMRAARPSLDDKTGLANALLWLLAEEAVKPGLPAGPLMDKVVVVINWEAYYPIYNLKKDPFLETNGASMEQYKYIIAY